MTAPNTPASNDFVLVPREPTPKMVAATWDHEIDREGGLESQNTRNKRIYAAMLAAAPAVVINGSGEEVSDGVHEALWALEAERERLRVDRDRFHEALTKIAGNGDATGCNPQLMCNTAVDALAAAPTSSESASGAASLPVDVAELVKRIGEAEWGATDAFDAEGHARHVADSVKATAEHFGQDGPQPMHGLYIKGTETVICHTGTSPNSGQIARALAGAWNHLRTLAASPEPASNEATGRGGVEMD